MKREDSRPPGPLTTARKIRLHPFQIVGIPLLVLVPILALFGVFGETVDAVSASNQQLEMHVKYPTRFRYKMIDTITVSLFNASSQSIHSVQVGFDQAYLDKFSTVVLTPSVKHVTDAVYLVEVNDLQPAETRVISVTIQAEIYGKHEGTIAAIPDGGEKLQVSIDTFTFP